MYRPRRMELPRRAGLRCVLLAATWLACAWPARGAQLSATAPAPVSLRQAFEAAWARQPEAEALPERRAAAQARQRSAQAWTPEPAALALSEKSDRLHRHRGAREWELGLAVPIWLPGERRGSAALAEAEGAAIESRARAAQLRVAADVREAWWQWQRARIEAHTVAARLDGARRIAADVARRTQAGELARADRHQADAAVAAAESELAQAEAGLAVAQQQLSAITGATPAADAPPASGAEPEPGLPPAEAAPETHATLQELSDRATVAEQAVALAATRSRANPELTLASTRERDAFGGPSQQTLTLGLRIPFDAGPRHEGRVAQARADAAEARAQLVLERDRLAAEHASARARVDATRRQLAAAERRAQLARESRGFFERSFQLGETDLPTRLRIELEAAEADRQAARSRIDLAAALSAWRQALGLLPQ